MVLGCAAKQPEAAWPRHPFFSCRFGSEIGGRIYASDLDVEDNPFCGHETAFLLLLDVYKRAASPALIEVEVFVDSMPFCRVELTGGEGETASTCLDGDVSDD